MKCWSCLDVHPGRGPERGLVIQAMEREGIPTRGYFSPVHLQPYIRERLGSQPGILPVTESIAKRTIALPFHGNLTEAEADRVVAVLTRAVGRGNP